MVVPSGADATKKTSARNPRSFASYTICKICVSVLRSFGGGRTSGTPSRAWRRASLIVTSRPGFALIAGVDLSCDILDHDPIRLNRIMV